MTERNEIYKCEICGNIVEILHGANRKLVCCNQEMVLQKEQIQDPEKGEKHIPVIEGKIIKIGSIPHPIEEEHHIEWIEATSNTGEICKVFLKPGDKPEAKFPFEPTSARAYCNIHNLWKA